MTPQRSALTRPAGSAGTGPRQPYCGRALRGSLFLVLLTFVTVAPAELWPFISRPALYHLRLPTAKASWYHLPGRTTASGLLYGGLTAASRTLAFGERRTLCRADRPRVCVAVTVVDRFGADDPTDRDYDLSRAAARKLGMLRAGVIAVTVRASPPGGPPAPAVAAEPVAP